MTALEKDTAVAPTTDLPIAKRMLNSMWGYWLFLLAISFGVAAAIYWIWLKGRI
jgi:hypothetical protein